MLKARLVTGPLLIAALVAVVWLDQLLDPTSMDADAWPRGVGLLALCLFVVGFAGAELAAIARHAGRRTSPVLVILGAQATLLATWLGGPAWTLVALAATWFASICTSARGRQTEGVPAEAAATTTMVLYLGGLLSFYLLLRQDVSAWWIAAVVLITKSCDIGAYFTGSLIGRHKLIPWLSPGKTVEGLAGGIVTAILVSMLASWALRETGHLVVSMPWAVLLGGSLAVAGQAGDLCMSLVKRDAGVKDSAAILPGMGGIMDVLDSPLLAAPVAWVILHAIM
ncbi:MAG: phosphatidate cytidylyltransferase [Phycisphaerales bacterium]|jgi:phosphatidate cytidylyltransferase|nr:phosphatidate cytidylyltransferase [Phycisphaerales bacterium]